MTAPPRSPICSAATNCRHHVDRLVVAAAVCAPSLAALLLGVLLHG